MTGLGQRILRISRVRLCVAVLMGSSVSGLAADLGSSSLPVLYEVPQFEFTDQNAASFSSKTLKGKVWVADFMFTSCKHECPLMTSAMKGVQTHLKDVKNVEFVSITTDPKHDTPPVLKAYMASHKVDTSNWRFLTGDKKKIVEVANKGFKFPVNEKNAGHSEKFALVDQNHKIRGFYESRSREDMKKLESDVRALTK